ncbi:hypothetical protein SNOG_11231 [Parastagonospora nodorum SN15]|uniref:Uncharacterized protein n=1 Tax=Phaeosphaeria nodorum (strain SN15 / ATCC MYA-4574 / FGSC 10173) TaxID=321614 RepID=Q0UAI3_PHANO|nr:hypothetical protein SNOG_11231 [Parastagonospora nodorum SN15]EAT81730.1 hypothetical protein SNOG_11231 [Parastagonospora nodorum SN15]
MDAFPLMRMIFIFGLPSWLYPSALKIPQARDSFAPQRGAQHGGANAGPDGLCAGGGRLSRLDRRDQLVMKTPLRRPGRSLN